MVNLYKDIINKTYIVIHNYTFSVQSCLPTTHKKCDQNSCYSDLSQNTEPYT